MNSNNVSQLPAMPTNVILRAKLDIIAKDAEIASLRASLQAMRDHVRGDKFRAESYINVTDVLSWIDQTRSAADDARNEAYTVERMRTLLLKDESSIEVIGAMYRLTVENVNYYAHKSVLEQALHVLFADGAERVEIYEWINQGYSDARWCYVRSRRPYEPVVVD